MNNTIKQLKKMGFKITKTARKTANGPDIHAVDKSGRTIRVEHKKVRKVRNSYLVHPVEKNRITDDLIAIEFPSGYVLIEPMADHLNNCSAKGGRCFTGIC